MTSFITDSLLKIELVVILLTVGNVKFNVTFTVTCGKSAGLSVTRLILSTAEP